MKKPLMVIGARQVGKTFIIIEFCKNEFDNFIYINLLDHPEMIEKTFDQKEIIETCGHAMYIGRKK